MSKRLAQSLSRKCPLGRTASPVRNGTTGSKSKHPLFKPLILNFARR